MQSPAGRRAPRPPTCATGLMKRAGVCSTSVLQELLPAFPAQHHCCGGAGLAAGLWRRSRISFTWRGWDRGVGRAQGAIWGRRRSRCSRAGWRRVQQRPRGGRRRRTTASPQRTWPFLLLSAHLVCCMSVHSHRPSPTTALHHLSTSPTCSEQGRQRASASPEGSSVLPRWATLLLASPAGAAAAAQLAGELQG